MPPSSNRSQLVCAGEIFADLIFFDLERLPSLGQEVKTDDFAISPGGGAAITAAAAARLGRPTQLATVWGASALDAEVRSRLEADGVSSSWSLERPDGMCGLTVAVSTREDRSFLTHPGANRFVEEHLLSAETQERSRSAGHVHFALTPTRWEAFRDAVAELRASGVTASWDLGWDPAAGRSQGFRDLCAALDVLFLNEMEARKYADASSTEEALAFFSHRRNTVVIKRGAAGAVAAQRGSPAVRVDRIEVDAVESTGAGDAFNGGFLHAWMQGMDADEALLAGNICGGLSTRSPGGVRSLPSATEFEERFDSLRGAVVARREVA